MFETVEIKDVKERVGVTLKAIRKQRKISRIELSEALDISKTTLQNIENGKNFTIDNLLKLLKEFDLLEDINRQLIGYQEQMTESKSLY